MHIPSIMALLTGSASFVRFTVEGELPEHFWDFVAERVAANSFRDIDDNMEEYSIGWVSVANMFDSDFAYGSYAAADYVVLTMRVDERKVAPAVLKKVVMKEEERVKLERQVQKLPRAVRLEIKDRVRTELLRKSVPVPATYDLCWNLADSTLLFFSTSRKAMAQLEDLFRDTFSVSIIQEIPWMTGARLIEPDNQPHFENLRPAILI